MPTHFQGQTSPVARPPILPMIVCYSLPSLLVIWISDVQIYKISRACLLLPFLWSWLAFTAMPVNFKGQTSPEACITEVLLMIVSYCSQSLLVIYIWVFKNAEIFYGHPFRPGICIWLAFTAMPAHVKGQTSQESRIPLILPMIVCYSSPSLFVIQILNFRNFSWTSNKTFAMQLFPIHGHADPFTG